MKSLIIALVTMTISTSAFAAAASHVNAVACGIAVSENEFVAESRAYSNPANDQYLSNPGILGTLLFELTKSAKSPVLKRGRQYCVWGKFIVPADGSEGSVEPYSVQEK
ncbi:hypothetical protein DOM22_15390 [Bdellovibrio sp. ZAP7]|uniref:hypothetical protein n=1 Tax=Bdellovibrio sp. ZAP7 TaxID=2231053 RepID=UPI00115C18F3|nr:hypothetical protein [Bdellovibrio sp. ZAP7]QDK46447.1 hypothetical protein DOM22_15390 [Bdellovibrio sp. ZAP7]